MSRPPIATFDSPLCAEVDPELFFPAKGAAGRDAVAVCLACEHAVECLAYALTNNVVGVWGATTGMERRKLRRQLGIIAAPVEVPNVHRAPVAAA